MVSQNKVQITDEDAQTMRELSEIEETVESSGKCFACKSSAEKMHASNQENMHFTECVKKDFIIKNIAINLSYILELTTEICILFPQDLEVTEQHLLYY